MPSLMKLHPLFLSFSSSNLPMEDSKRKILISAGKALYGERWQTDLAIALGYADARRIRQWLSGDRPIPETIYADLSGLLVSHKATIDDCLCHIQDHLLDLSC